MRWLIFEGEGLYPAYVISLLAKRRACIPRALITGGIMWDFRVCHLLKMQVPVLCL